MAAPRGPLPASGTFFLLAAAPRLAYLFFARPPFDTSYWALATGLLHDGSLSIDGVRSTDFEPVYPIILAIARLVARDQVLAVQILQVCAASLGAIFIYRLANTLTGRTSVAAAAAVLFAFDPVLVRQAAQASESALVTTLLLVFTCYFITATTTVRAAWAGVWLGIAVLTRTMLLPLVILGPVLLLTGRQSRRALTLALLAILVILPFPVRNHAINGSWWPTRSGLNLWEGNSEYTAAVLPDEDVDILQEQATGILAQELPHLSALSPEQANRAVDALLAKRALAHMRDHPWRTIAQKALNVVYFMSPRLVPLHIATPDTHLVIGRAGEMTVANSISRPLVEVVPYALFQACLLVFVPIGVYLRRREFRRDAMLWCIVATFVAVYAVYFPATRYRAPMSFVLCFYAAVALDRGAARVSPAPVAR